MDEIKSASIDEFLRAVSQHPLARRTLIANHSIARHDRDEILCVFDQRPEMLFTALERLLDLLELGDVLNGGDMAAQLTLIVAHRGTAQVSPANSPIAPLQTELAREFAAGARGGAPVFQDLPPLFGLDPSRPFVAHAVLGRNAENG